jgi:hypothetical protein
LEITSHDEAKASVLSLCLPGWLCGKKFTRFSSKLNTILTSTS